MIKDGDRLGRRKKKTKNLEELTIVDDFMFGAVMSDPKRCKPLLEFILNIKIDRIEYPELQKTIDKQYRSRSVRLDVYVSDGKGTVYNIEIQTTRRKNLPRRMRYYQGMIDLNIIDKGEDYSSLQKSFVIFICTYDPFGANRYKYTFENQCQEDNTISLGDGATKIVLNAKGSVGEISDDLKDMLDFMVGKTPKGAYARDLEEAVDEVKKSEKWRREYMTLFMRDKEQQKFGKYVDKVSVVRNSGNVVTNDILAKLLGIDVLMVERIQSYISEHPDWDDEDIADELLEEEDA